MKKIKYFDSFVSENVETENEEIELNENEEYKLNENIWNELFSHVSSMDAIEQVYYWLGLSVEAISLGLFGKTVASLATGGALALLKDKKLGERGKEFAELITRLGQKSASLFKRKDVDEEVVDEVNVELKHYNDIIDRLNQGELGEEGVNLAKKIEAAQEAAEEVQ